VTSGARPGVPGCALRAYPGHPARMTQAQRRDACATSSMVESISQCDRVGMVADGRRLLPPAGPDEDDDVDAQSPIRPAMPTGEALGELDEPASFGGADREFTRKAVAGAGFHLDENDRPVAGFHNEINFAAGKTDVSLERAQPGLAEVGFGEPFAPPSEGASRFRRLTGLGARIPGLVDDVLIAVAVAAAVAVAGSKPETPPKRLD